MKNIGYLLDTNIITALLKKNEKVNRELDKVSSQEQEVFISCITFYEIKRGLLYNTFRLRIKQY